MWWNKLFVCCSMKIVISKKSEARDCFPFAESRFRFSPMLAVYFDVILGHSLEFAPLFFICSPCNGFSTIIGNSFPGPWGFIPKSWCGWKGEGLGLVGRAAEVGKHCHWLSRIEVAVGETDSSPGVCDSWITTALRSVLVFDSIVR